MPTVLSSIVHSAHIYWPQGATFRHLIIGVTASLGYFIIHCLWIWPFLLSPLRSVPGPPLGNLVLGQSPTIVRSESGIPQREWVKKYGPVVRVVGPVGIERLILMKPEALHHILVKHWLEYPRPSFLRNILGLVTGHGLLTVTGNEHRQMRKAMNPAFSIPNLMAQTDMYYKAIDGLVEILKSGIDGQKVPGDGKEFHMYDWMSKVTLDIICETAFGYNADSLHDPHNELAEAYEQLLSLQSGPNLAKIIILMSVPGAPRLIGSKWAYDHRHWFSKLSFFKATGSLIDAMYRIRRVSASMLREKLQDSAVLVSDTDAKRDIMSLLVRARKADLDKDKGIYAMSDQAMMDQVLTFLGAGHETTATGLSWTLWLLANDQESQNKLRDEVAPVFADNPRPDYRSLKDLQWLDCVIMESLRVLPPVPLTVRTTTQADYVDGVLVPKGTLLTIPIRIVNTWKVVWGEDAEDFSPKRWLNLPKNYHPVFSMLSFIAGPHACIGKTMAIIEMKAVLAALIANFSFEPAYTGQTTKPAAAITMKPTDGMPLRVKRVSPAMSSPR
ncbi:cytochrome P450 [Lyophyllum atratum]|nr:cytochrome P450 [Lyophyllum atratum]